MTILYGNFLLNYGFCECKQVQIPAKYCMVNKQVNTNLDNVSEYWTATMFRNEGHAEHHVIQYLLNSKESYYF